MASIVFRPTKKGIKRYAVKIRIKGVMRCKTFGGINEAKKWAKATESLLKSKFDLVTINENKYTLGDLIDYYIEHYLPRKPKSYKDYLRQLTWWKKQLGKYLLADITKSMIIQCRDSLIGSISRNNKKILPSSANRFHASLSHVFTVATKELEWIEKNPFLNIRKLKEPKGRVRYLSDIERETLLHECRVSKNPLIFTIVVVALSTGARRSEILNLKWKDVDFERQRAILHDTKNGEKRILTLKGYALQLLENLYTKNGDMNRYVFARSDGKLPIEIKRAWENVVIRAKLEDFRFHDLRHSAASYLAMNGATMLEIAEVLGHKTLDMVKRYSHLSESHTSKVIEDMNNKMFN